MRAEVLFDVINDSDDTTAFLDIKRYTGCLVNTVCDVTVNGKKDRSTIIADCNRVKSEDTGKGLVDLLAEHSVAVSADFTGGRTV